MQNELLPDIHKIAVFRATALGDFIFALPALETLRAAYPQAEIVYLGRAWHTGFVPGRVAGPLRVIAVPPARSHQIAQGLVTDPDLEAEIFQRLRSENFDLALQMHGGGVYSNPFILNLHARHTAGLKSPSAAPLERWIPYIYYQSEVMRMLEVVSLVGACAGADRLAPRLPVLESDLAAASGPLAQLTRPFVVIHPGSTDPRRCWSPAKFAAVGDFCAGLGCQVVLTGTAMEAGYIQAVEASMRAPAVNLCDCLSLPGLVGLLSKAALFAGNDSGPLHLAMAVGAPALGLFWVEYIVNSLPLFRRSFYPLIAWQRRCPRCGAFLDKAELDAISGVCDHALSMLEEITPPDVIQGVEVLLSQAPAVKG